MGTLLNKIKAITKAEASKAVGVELNMLADLQSSAKSGESLMKEVRKSLMRAERNAQAILRLGQVLTKQAADYVDKSKDLGVPFDKQVLNRIQNLSVVGSRLKKDIGKAISSI